MGRGGGDAGRVSQFKQHLWNKLENGGFLLNSKFCSHDNKFSMYPGEARLTGSLILEQRIPA